MLIRRFLKKYLNNETINLIKRQKFNNTNLGRWKIEEDFDKTKLKIDYANIDNCGPCGYEINNKIK